MERCQTIEHRGARILLFDYAGLRDPAVLLEEFRRMAEVVRAQPLASVLGVTDVRGCVYSWTVLHAMKDLLRGNGPHMRASAAVLDRPELRVALDALTVLTGRNIKAFSNLEEAMDWLVTQK